MPSVLQETADLFKMEGAATAKEFGAVCADGIIPKRFTKYSRAFAAGCLSEFVKKREVETVNMDALPLAVIDDPIEKIMQQDDYDILLSVISKLPLAHRELIFLRYVQGKEVKEIAELLHRTPNYIRVQSFRARQQLLELCREVGMEIE